MLTRVPVNLGERSYDIRIGAGALSHAADHLPALKLGARGAIITDDRVAPLYGQALQDTLGQAGHEAAALYDQLLDARLDRRSFIVALGGGVVGDLAGFVAATFLRGVPLVQAPTTLLAQVDSSVGGKVGVNLPRGKNLVGAFYQPRLVLVDTKTLDTLPLREFRSGLAEVIKYGIIYDAKLFAGLENNVERVLQRELTLLEPIIARCCAIKAEIVSKDERENGLRAILNFGHTIGHAIEAVTKYGELLHGEAIAIGMVCAAELSQRRAGLPAGEAERIRKVFQRYGFERNRPGMDFDSLLAAMKVDKKALAGHLRFVLVPRIGQATLTDAVTASELREVLQ
jgi:3-dehydroquinate synthase